MHASPAHSRQQLSLHISSRCWRILTAFALLPGLAGWLTADEPDPERAELVFKRLHDRFNDASGDREKLRNDLLALRRNYAGTPASLKAAGLITQMASALDRLDAKTIAPLEKFTWQPKELVGVLGEHRGRHGNPVTAVAFSPDGKYVVSGGGSYYLRVWNPATMRLEQTASFGAISVMSFSKDGKMLVVANSGGAIGLFDVGTGAAPLTPRWTTTGGTSVVYSIAFCPDNKKFAIACFDNHIRIYDATVKTPKDPVHLVAHEKAVQAVAYSPDGKTLASGGADNVIKLWDAAIEIPKERTLLIGSSAPVTALAYKPDGSVLASACSDGTLRLWNANAVKGAKPATVFGDSKHGHIYGINFSGTGQTLAAACGDGTARLWNVVTGARPRERGKCEGHAPGSYVSSVMYSPDNKLIVTGGSDWMVRTWDATGAVPKERFVPWSHISYVYSSAISPDCQTLASGSLDKVLRLWDINRPEPRTRNYIKGDAIPIYNVVYSPDGSRLAVSGTLATVRQWDSTTGRPLRPCGPVTGAPATVAYSPDGKHLLAHYGPVVHLFDPQTGQEERQLTGHTTNIYSCSFSPDGRKVITSAGYYLFKDGKIVEINKVPQYTDCTVRLWDVEKGDELCNIKSHKLPVYRAFFSPDGQYFYAGGSEPSLLRRETAAPNKPETPAFPGFAPVSYYFMYSPDGTKMLITNGAWSIKLFDVATWKPLWEWNSPEIMGNITFASDSRHLAISLSTGVVYVMRLAPPVPGK